MADYQIGIDLPGDLIAKLMVQGERSAPVRHTGVDEENLGKITYLSLSPALF